MVLKFLRGAAVYVSGRMAKLAPDSIRLEAPSAIVGVRGTTVADPRRSVRLGDPSSDVARAVPGAHYHPGRSPRRMRTEAQAGDEPSIARAAGPGRPAAGSRNTQHRPCPRFQRVRSRRPRDCARRDASHCRRRSRTGDDPSAEATSRVSSAMRWPPCRRRRSISSLQFRFESDTLTEESTALIPVILRAVKALAVPEVVVVGHTDTMGDPKIECGARTETRRERARHSHRARDCLPSTIDIASHGEADLLRQDPQQRSRTAQSPRRDHGQVGRVPKPSAVTPRRLILLSVFVPVIVTVCLAIYRPAVLVRLEDATYDIVLRIAGTTRPDPGVVIVDVDERSLEAGRPVAMATRRRRTVDHAPARRRRVGDCAGHRVPGTGSVRDAANRRRGTSDDAG